LDLKKIHSEIMLFMKLSTDLPNFSFRRSLLGLFSFESILRNILVKQFAGELVRLRTQMKLNDYFKMYGKEINSRILSIIHVLHHIRFEK
jgi:hypothetical protein